MIEALDLLFFYDPKSLSTSDNIVKVWVKLIFTERGKQDCIKRYGEKYKNLDHALGLFKIDCTKRKVQILSSIYYASDGSVINSYNYPESSTEWYPIPPESGEEYLFKRVCQVRNK